MRVRGRGHSVLKRLASLALAAALLGACATAPEKPLMSPEKPAAASADTGSCRPFFISPSLDWGDGAPRHSCWHRLWEVPVALVAVPLAIGVFTAPVWVPIILLK